MTIDPKKIAEWAARVEKQRASVSRSAAMSNWDPEEWAFWGDPLAELLAERDEMLRKIERITLDEVEVHDPGDGVRFVRVTVQADSAEQRHRTADWLKRVDRDREEMLALLRELQSVKRVNEDGAWWSCDICGEDQGSHDRPERPRHTPDCRLAAFLRSP